MTITPTTVDDLQTWAISFRSSMEATNKSPRTIETYLDAVGQLGV
jgi:hypothetical protein